MNKGYADLYLQPFAAGYPGIRYGYVIELKYLKRGENWTSCRRKRPAGRRCGSCVGTWPTSGCGAIRACGTSALGSCSTAGRWSSATLSSRRGASARTRRSIPAERGCTRPTAPASARSTSSICPTVTFEAAAQVRCRRLRPGLSTSGAARPRTPPSGPDRPRSSTPPRSEPPGVWHSPTLPDPSRHLLRKCTTARRGRRRLLVPRRDADQAAAQLRERRHRLPLSALKTYRPGASLPRPAAVRVKS